jgi:hypothetical protein
MSNPTSQASQAERETMPALPVPETLGKEGIPIPATASETRADETQPAATSEATVQRDVEAKTRFAEFAHQYIREYIAHADRKATFFFTGATALLAFLYNKNLSARWIKPVMSWNVLDVLTFVTMAALAVGSFLALLVVIPRGRGSRRGFLFWEAIAEYNAGRTYSDDLSRLSAASLFQLEAEHCFDLARICRSKYCLLRWSLWIGAVGLVGALLVFLTHSV